MRFRIKLDVVEAVVFSGSGDAREGGGGRKKAHCGGIYDQRKLRHSQFHRQLFCYDDGRWRAGSWLVPWKSRK